MPGYAIPDNAWPTQQKLLRDYAGGKLAAAPAQAEVPQGTAVNRVILLEQALPVGGSARAIQLKRHTSSQVIDLWLPTDSSLRGSWRINVAGGDNSPEFPATASAEQVLLDLQAWPPLEPYIDQVLLGGALRRWRLVLKADAPTLTIDSETAGLVIHNNLPYVPSGQRLTVFDARAPQERTDIPLAAQVVAHLVGDQYVVGEQPALVDDTATTPNTISVSTCCSEWLPEGEIDDCDLTGEVAEFFDVSGHGVSIGPNVPVLGYDAACIWESDSFEMTCDSGAVVYVWKLRPKTGVAIDALPTDHADYLELILQPVDGVVPTNGTACRQRLVWTNRRRFLPLGSTPFDLDPTQSIIYMPEPLSTACEVCVRAVIDPAFVDTDDTALAACAQQTGCDLATLYEPPQIPREIEFTIDNIPVVFRPVDQEVLGTKRLSLGGCGHRFELEYNQWSGCTVWWGGGWVAGPHYRDSLQITFDLCTGRLTITQNNSLVNCDDSDLSRNWGHVITYEPDVPAPWDLTQPLTLHLVRAVMTDVNSVYGGGGSTVVDQTADWQSVQPTITLTPVTT